MNNTHKSTRKSPLNWFHNPLMGSSPQFESSICFDFLSSPQLHHLFPQPCHCLALGNFHTNYYWFFTDLPTLSLLPHFHKIQTWLCDFWFRMLHCLPIPFVLEKLSPKGEVHTQETRPHHTLGSGIHFNNLDTRVFLCCPLPPHPIHPSHI